IVEGRQGGLVPISDSANERYEVLIPSVGFNRILGRPQCSPPRSLSTRRCLMADSFDSSLARVDTQFRYPITGTKDPMSRNYSTQMESARQKDTGTVQKGESLRARHTRKL